MLPIPVRRVIRGMADTGRDTGNGWTRHTTEITFERIPGVAGESLSNIRCTELCSGSSGHGTVYFSTRHVLSMEKSSARTSPLFRLGVTIVGLAGLLVTAALTGSLAGLVTVDGAVLGLVLSGAVAAFAWRYPDEFVSTPRSEAIALVVAWTAGVMFGLYAPEFLVVSIWVLVWTVGGLAVLVVGRPKRLARIVARVERSSSPRR